MRIGAKIDDLFKLMMKHLGMKTDSFTDDAMMKSITDDMKKIKVDPDFKMYNIIMEKDDSDKGNASSIYAESKTDE